MTEENPVYHPLAFYDADGIVRQRSTVPDVATADRLAARLGLRWMFGPPPEPCYVDGDHFVLIPAQPSPAHEFDQAAKVWVQRSVDTQRTARIRALDAAFARAAGALTDGYPEAERMTWPTQQAEALAWAVDPAAPTPFLDGIAAARQIDPADMRAKTLEAVQAFMAASQVLVGTRQRLRDAVLAAGTEAEIAAVVWPS